MRTDLSPKTDRGAARFVWLIWAVMLIAALGYSASYGSRLPHTDEYELVPVLTGERPLTLGWLWERRGVTRFPLMKVVYVITSRVFAFDLRAMQYFNTMALGAVAFAFIRAAKAHRGRTRYADALFPLVLLQWGRAPDFLWSIQISNIWPFLLLSTLLIVVLLGRGTPLAIGPAVLAGVCLVLLPLSGGGGEVHVPAFAIWLAVSGVLHWRSPGPRSKLHGLVILTLVILAVTLTVLSLVGHPTAVRYLAWQFGDATFGSGGQASDTPTPHALPDAWAFARTTLELFSLGTGAPREGWLYAGLAVLGLLLLTAMRLVSRCHHHPSEWYRAAGLILLLGSGALLILTIGWHRAHLPPGQGLNPHYIVLLSPMICAVYFAWGVCESWVGRFVQVALFALACALLPHNMLYGVSIGEWHRDKMAILDRDLKSGASPAVVAERHWRFQTPWHTEAYLATRLGLLHRAGVGPFRSMQTPIVMERPQPAVLVASHDVACVDKTCHAHGDSPFVTMALSEPQFVYAIRVRYTATSRLRGMAWRRAGEQRVRPCRARACAAGAAIRGRGQERGDLGS